MLENGNLPTDYSTAEGPAGLTKALGEILEKTKQDSAFAAKEHYVLYEIGNQKSLIKVNMSQEPFQFWYSDLKGRPIPRIIKETIALFLWEKTAKKDQFFPEQTGKLPEILQTKGPQYLFECERDELNRAEAGENVTFTAKGGLDWVLNYLHARIQDSYDSAKAVQATLKSSSEDEIFIPQDQMLTDKIPPKTTIWTSLWQQGRKSETNFQEVDAKLMAQNIPPQQKK